MRDEIIDVKKIYQLLRRNHLLCEEKPSIDLQLEFLACIALDKFSFAQLGFLPGRLVE